MTDGGPLAAKPIEEERETLLEQIHGALDGPMIVLSVAWVALIVVEFAGDGLAPSLYAAVWMIWAVFIFNFAIEFTIAPVKRRYLRTHWLTVLSLVLPAFRILRVASALRVLRMARVVRRRPAPTPDEHEPRPGVAPCHGRATRARIRDRRHGRCDRCRVGGDGVL